MSVLSEPYEPAPQAQSYSGRPLSGNLVKDAIPKSQPQTQSYSGLLPAGNLTKDEFSRSQPQSAPEEKNPQKQKIDDINIKLQETKDALQDNIQSLIERGERIEHLEEHSQKLGVSAKTFKTQAAQTRRKFWWKNKKWTIALIVLGIIIVGGIIGGAVKGSK
nr:hypothetical protein L204_00690 [Cryptococcus depauperatus CBS 7855]